MSESSALGSATEAALAYLSSRSEEHAQQLDGFLRIESVSADPTRTAEVRRAAQWIAAELNRIGMHRVTLHETSGHPIVTAESMGAGPDAPTVLVYCHYDVQPSDPLEAWIRPPFQPRYEDDRIYARGAGDDKGQLFMHLKAAEAWLATAGRIPVNLRFLFEGDEEVDPGPVEAFVRERADLLAADICVVSDTSLFDDDGTPAITYGLRGIAHFRVTVRGPGQDLHSGIYGGGVGNPANVLARLLAELTDCDGRVTVPGFYDEVVELTAAERDATAAVPFDETAWRDAIGVPAAAINEPSYTLVERLTVRPTLDIHGIHAGYAGDAVKTIIPAHAEATFSARLVPNQNHAEIGRRVEEYLRSLAPSSVRIDVSARGAPPAITPLDHPAVRIAAAALESGFGRPPVLIRGGGSIPIVAALRSELGLNTVMVGFASPNGNFHAPNEWMPLRNVRDGLTTLVHLWAMLGSAKASTLHVS